MRPTTIVIILKYQNNELLQYSIEGKILSVYLFGLFRTKSMFVLLIRLLFFDKLIGGSAILTTLSKNIHHTYSTEIKHD